MTASSPDKTPDLAQQGSEVLVDLGFSALEAKVYVSLLAGAPQTGYQIAHTIDKPVANTYKAIKSLAQKGAVLVTAGNKRICRAVPYSKLLDKLGRDFRASCDRAEEALAGLPPQMSDEGVYDLRSADQVADRFVSMLDQAEDHVVIDAFPEVITGFIGDIERCSRRGIRVTLKVYQPLEVPGVDVVLAFPRQNLMGRWPGQWLNIVIDASQHMLAYLTPDCRGVLRAIWSDSEHLASIYSGGIYSEITLDKIGAVLQRRGSHEDIRDAFKFFDKANYTDTPGRQTLLGQNSPDDRQADKKRKGEK